MTILKNSSNIIAANSKLVRQNWSIGDGLSFDGINDCVELYGTETSNLSFSRTNPFSISIFINHLGSNSDSTASMIFSKFTNTDSIGYYITFPASVTNDKIQIMLRNGDINTNNLFKSFQSDVIQLNTILHIIAINTDGTLNGLKLFVNGNEITTYVNFNDSTPNIDNTEIAVIGKIAHSSSTYFLNSIIYDLKVFNKALTQSEISDIYLKKGQLIPSSANSNCVLNYAFNNKQGTTLNDQSGNNYNGTLINYAAGTTTLGATNSWKNKYNNSITTL